METQSISRRDFCKSAATAVGALALASAGIVLKPSEALAATTLADGTYTISANLYVPPTEHGITVSQVKDKNAYFTNTANPFAGQYPTEAVPNNATLVVSGGKYTLTIPLVNTVFRLTQLSGNSDFTINTTKTGSYITSVELSGTSLPTAGTYVFDDCKEFALFPAAAGNHSWDVNLDIDYGNLLN